MINKIKKLIKENNLLVFILMYGLFYIVTFRWLENRNVQINIIFSELDKLIPFCEYFIVPYFLWFVYVIFTIVYFIFFCKERNESKRFIYSFCIGMTVFLFVSYVYPNGHNLRPDLTGNSIFIKAVKFLHRIDTPTNILPSMHVFATVASSIALLRQKLLRDHKGFAHGLWICSILIVLSTVFLKQHSVIDVIAALILNGFCYIGMYKIAYNKITGIDTFRRKRIIHD